MRALIVALTLFAAPAFAGNYALVCTAPCTASDGTTQPTGTVLAKILWDGVTPYAPAGMSVVPFTGQKIYTPPVPVPTTLAALAFIGRFTPAEQSTLMTANPVWGVQIAAAGTIDVTDPTLIADMQAAVSGGALTQARMTQILNLAVASP